MAPTAGRDGRRAVVHVGLNKAGSSTIQAWLLDRRAALAAEGIAYDRMEGPGPRGLDMATGWHNLAWSLSTRRGAGWKGHEPAAAFAARADAAWAGPGTRLAVISSEYIADRIVATAALRAFAAWLGERFEAVDYVLYLRDQTQWLPSAYAQMVKTGGSEELGRFIERRGANDHFALARRWHRAAAEAPGRQRLHVRLLEPDALRGGDLLTDFAHLLGVDPGAAGRHGRHNVSMPALRLGVLRRANRAGDRLAAWGLPGAKPWLARATRALDRAGPPLRLSPAEAARVAAMNAESNERLRAWLFPERPVLYPRAPAPTPFRAPEPSRGAPSPEPSLRKA